jgi:purine nucleosidase
LRLIVDTDLGIDDAIALFMVLAQPAIQIEAITTVFGNVSLAQATHNVGVILDVVGAPVIPIYKGNGKPLLQDEPRHALEVHGLDGLGGVGKTETRRTVEPEQASLALLRLAGQNPGEFTLLTLGPLTNIALAIRLDADFLKKIKRLVMMAGAVEGRGNTSPPAEFNIAADPEAAKIVFAACSRAGLQPELISWETTLAHPISVVDWEQMIAGESAVARLVQGMTSYVKQRLSSTYQFFLWPDPLAAAVAIVPDIILSQESRHLEVETSHNLARGQTIVDYRRRSRQEPNAHIIREINMQKFQTLLQMAIS